jgi:hypothetical protein
MAGPSTSDGRELPRRLSRKQLLERVSRWTTARYGFRVDDGWLADLIKDAFIEGAERVGNVGLRPDFTYGWRSYRSALQLARMRHHGFVERHAIQIRMFLSGYGRILDIRDALSNQYRKVGRSALAKTRSGYLDNTKIIPPGHEGKLVKSFKSLAPVLELLPMPNEDYIAALRAARKPPKDLKELRALWDGGIKSPMRSPLRPLRCKSLGY